MIVIKLRLDGSSDRRNENGEFLCSKAAAKFFHRKS